MGTFQLRRFSPGSGPEPSRIILVGMLDELEKLLLNVGEVPIEIFVCSWCKQPRSDLHRNGLLLSQINLISRHGEMVGRHPLRRWYQWQHPRWDLAISEPPTIHIPKTLPSLAQMWREARP